VPAALADLRVLDAAEGVAAGYCTRLLAGLGADVIKIERPARGDTLRRSGPFPSGRPHIETSGVHLHLNAAKRSITLDLRTATGAALFARLLPSAHAVIAPAAAHPALDDALAQAQCVVTRISGCGSGGPRAHWRAPEIVAMALGGYLSLNGDPDREPVMVWGEQAQYQAGVHAALGIVAALRHGEQHPGRAAERVDVAAAEAAAFLNAGALQRWRLMRRPQVRAGARPAGFGANRLYPSTVRPCADGHVHVHCHNRHHELISLLMEEPRLRDPDILAEPLAHAGEIDALMDRWLASRTRAQAVAAAQEMRIPMTEVRAPREVLADQEGHLRARGFFATVEHPHAGALRMPGPPLRIDGQRWRVARAPLLGEHNVDVYCDELGLAPRDLARLRAAGVV